MKNIQIIFLLCLSLFSIESIANDFSKAMDFSNKGAYKSMVSLLQELASKGNPDAQLKLAKAYRFGHGVPSDLKQAIHWYEKAANQNNLSAQRELRIIYSGNYIGKPYIEPEIKKLIDKGIIKINMPEKDQVKEEYWGEKVISGYKKTAENGDVKAYKKLSIVYENGLGTKKNKQQSEFWKKKGLEAFKKEKEQKAEQGDFKTQLILVMAYAKNDFGLKANPQRRQYWYKKVKKNAEQYKPDSQSILVKFYSEGFGNIKPNKNEADFWYEIIKKSADNNDSDAQLQLAFFYKEGLVVKKNKVQSDLLYNKVIDFYIKIAEQGDIDKQLQLGELYEPGKSIYGPLKDFITKSIDKAIYWFKKSAEQGNLSAQKSLVRLYTNDKYISKNKNEVIYWSNKISNHYKKSAEQGDVKAQFNLGMSYDPNKRNKVEAEYFSDAKESIYWYKKAANELYSSVSELPQKRIGDIYRQGVTKDFKKAIAWYEKAVKLGDKKSAEILGNMYGYGNGVSRDIEKSIYWYKKSVENGGFGYMLIKFLDIQKLEQKNLLAQKECEKTAKIKLFQVKIKCADRNQMRAAIKKGGGKVKREENRYFGDTYYSDGVLKGSSELFVTYTDYPNNKFALAQYLFPSHMDTLQVRKIKNLLVNKYGKPDYISGRIDLGPVSYKWYSKNGVEIKVSRGWPDTSTYLTYTYPNNNKIRLVEVENIKKARVKKESMSQSNAF